MRFAIYKGQSLQAVVESPAGEKIDPLSHAEALRQLNGADSVVPIDDEGHEAQLRAKNARIRDLRQQARTLKQAGTTYSAMTAGQRQIINELVALLSDSVPLAVP